MEKIHYSRKEYREQYLRSEEWRLLSAAILLRDPMCRLCEKNKSNDAHHLTYERIHHELPDDLIGVCRKCHNLVHKYLGIAQCNTLRALKAAIEESRSVHRLDEPLVKKIFALNHRAFLLCAGVLKIPAHTMQASVGKRLTYSQWIKIARLLKCNPRADIPNKAKYRRHPYKQM